jgi:hypothetical protein
LLQNEQQLLAPVAFQAASDFLPRGLNPNIGESGQLVAISLSFRMACRMAMPVTPLMSVITLANCTFISVSTFCIR